MNDEPTEESDEEQRRGVIAPLADAVGSALLAAQLEVSIAPAQHPGPVEASASGSPLQHSTGAESPGASSLQHSRHPQGEIAGQHHPGLQSAGHETQATAQHETTAHSGGEQGGQHTSGGEVGATTGQRNTLPEHAPASDEVARHTGLRGPKSDSRFRQLVRRAAQRPRGAALVGVSAAAATIAVVAIVAAQQPSTQREIAAADPTVIIDTTAAPEATAPAATAPAATVPAATVPAVATTQPPEATLPATTAGPTTTAQQSTTAAPTTTSLLSAAGSYSVTTSDYTVSAPESDFSQSFPGSSSVMILDGPCDSVGPCVANFGNGAFVVADVTEFAPGTNAALANLGLSPNGAGAYIATVAVPVDVDCGDDLIINVTLILGSSAPTGSMDFSSAGTGVPGCPTTTWNFTFTTVKSG